MRIVLLRMKPSIQVGIWVFVGFVERKREIIGNMMEKLAYAVAVFAGEKGGSNRY